LTEALVREIRDRYAAGGVTYRQLSEEYGISHGHVGNLIQRKTWPDI
jgi:hypothetical protein